MPIREDLGEAVRLGIIEPRQIERLASFLEARARGEVLGAADREEVRFARGFQDVFLTLGIAILFVGIIATSIAIGQGVALSLIAAALSWGLAEVFARRRRLVLPSMALSIIFILSVGLSVFGLAAGSYDPMSGLLSNGLPFLIASLVAWAASGVFYLRFRLPFALAVFAAGGVAVLVSAVLTASPDPGETTLSAVILPAGLAIFGFAMAYDLSDPRRVTLSADNAFWLHLLAAPLILNGAFGLLTTWSADMDTGSAVSVVAAVLLLGLVAIVVDRRALLVAGLAYLGYAIGQLIYAADIEPSMVAAVTLVLLGGGVILLGAGWRGARRALLAVLPLPTNLTDRLPASTDHP